MNTTTFTYRRSEDGFLEILSNDDVVWRGQPDGHPVAKVMPLDEGCVVLRHQGDAENTLSDLVRVNSEGKIVWRAQLPEADGADGYVTAWLTKGTPHAISGSCWYVTLDAGTGAIKTATFTK